MNKKPARFRHFNDEKVSQPPSMRRCVKSVEVKSLRANKAIRHIGSFSCDMFKALNLGCN